jgi:hypothetical protein
MGNTKQCLAALLCGSTYSHWTGPKREVDESLELGAGHDTTHGKHQVAEHCTKRHIQQQACSFPKREETYSRQAQRLTTNEYILYRIGYGLSDLLLLFLSRPIYEDAKEDLHSDKSAGDYIQSDDNHPRQTNNHVQTTTFAASRMKRAASKKKKKVDMKQSLVMLQKEKCWLRKN